MLYFFDLTGDDKVCKCTVEDGMRGKQGREWVREMGITGYN